MGYQPCMGNLNNNITFYEDFLKDNFLTQIIKVAFVLFNSISIEKEESNISVFLLFP